MKLTHKNGQYGSVTVILTMVLVPMVVIAGIFVDGGRALLAQSVVKSTEQLALNHVLAQNDADLHQLFGLLAVIDSEDLDAQAQEIMQLSLTGGADQAGGDILQVGLSPAGAGDTVSPVSNASLAQSEILANQMIEFMKYRAPANFVAQLLESVQWLTTMKTNMEMIRAKVAYLNEVTDVIDEAAKLLEQVNAIVSALETLIQAATAFSTLNDQDSIALIYSDALSQILIDHQGESGDDFTAEKEAELDARLKSAHDAISNLQGGVETLETSLSGFSTKPLKDAIAGLTDEADAYKSAISVQESATTPENVDVVTSTEELEGFESSLAEITEALDQVGDSFVVDLQSIASGLVDGVLESAVVSAADFSQWDTYDGLKTYADGYIDRVTASNTILVEDAVAQLREALRTATEAVIDSLFNELKEEVSDQIQVAIQGLKNALSNFTVEVVGEEAKVSISEFFKAMNEQLKKYESLIDGLANEKASPYLTDGGDESLGIVTERPSNGAPITSIASAPQNGEINDREQLAGGADDLLSSIGGIFGSLKEVLSGVLDSILIAEYIVGQFTYSSLAESGGDGLRLTGTPLCAGDECAAEAEYILTGDSTPRATYGLVFLVRLGANLVTAFRDPVVAAIRAAVTTIPFVGAALSFIAPIVAAIIQSVEDLSSLAAGKAVALYSSQLSVLDSGQIVGLLVDEFDDVIVIDRGEGDGVLDLTYAHYLEIFLIFGLISSNRDAIVTRAGDLIQFNIGYLGREDFRMAQASTAFTVSAEYRVKPLVSSFFTFEDAGGGLFEGANGLRRLTSVGGY